MFQLWERYPSVGPWFDSHEESICSLHHKIARDPSSDISSLEAILAEIRESPDECTYLTQSCSGLEISLNAAEKSVVVFQVSAFWAPTTTLQFHIRCQGGGFIGRTHNGVNGVGNVARARVSARGGRHVIVGMTEGLETRGSRVEGSGHVVDISRESHKTIDRERTSYKG